MKSGELDQRITIETEAPATTNTLGEDVPGWLFLAEVSAKVTETRGREFLAGTSGDYRPEHKAVFTVRWTELDATARIKWNRNIYRVDDVTGTFRDGWTWLHCTSTGETY